MNSPIANRVNTIFVHVSDLMTSVQWYSQLLGQEYNEKEVVDPVYNLKINHHTGITLDAGATGANKQIRMNPYPLFNFHTDDIEEAYKFAEKIDCKIESEIVKFEDFSYFTISDPDHNIIMICTG